MNEKKAIKKAFQDAEDRVMKAIKVRIIELKKDKKLAKKMEKDIKKSLFVAK